MKKLLSVVIIALWAIPSQAQFTKASLQATGLTCAMCSNAVNKALQNVSFVESVQPDIKNSAFNIKFKQEAEVNIDAIKDAVEDAGFSIGSLHLTGTFSGLKIADDQHIKIGTDNFHFLDVTEQTLDGERTITVVDKNYLTAKQFKKIISSTNIACLQTGKTAECFSKGGVPANARVYHVTI